jgi:hypothetical protein
MRKAAIASGVIGLVLMIGAGLMAWWITPSYIARLPGDWNKTRTYTGTIRSLVDPAALASGNLAAAIKTGVPEKLSRVVKVQQTSGNTALVKDATTVDAAGRPLASLTSNYALDRQSLEATRSHPSNWTVVNAKGLTVSWPLGAQKHNYTGWVPQTESTTTLRYVKQEQHAGINTYVYQASVPTTPVKNTQLLRNLPKALPVGLLHTISAAGLISSSELAGLARAFPHATTIPLGYTYSSTSTYWVAPSTGIVVDTSTAERQLGGIKLPTGKVVPLLPVLSDSYHYTSGTVSAAVTDANNGSNTIHTWGVIVPIIAAIVGFLLLLLAVILWLRSRGAGQHLPPQPSTAGPTAAAKTPDTSRPVR